ncbi:uncharacterized protein MONOS_12449 [Monocercomonoides exilis]|uniref:uncharacterized protein n=1 Tax=Monocercomonoides exilis TaxID=2049356 RepID=UPI00355A782A|nr:hypothetical protein MONOS_12449 [Monocercomonoides exilis]|eukprot:MONOS_12449.1-p1 / transcript=MONOS_12449.1 / gene=MONOS_12449 / organism=Monocercomonoides_exilis_PA203 / gene_product=unspecified product / transcript_product=unspecified product / location=Mono_scaffold00690:30346-31734(+) / protein_length=447 / sequence_SO=supercontig / SO=protein_coding / is_pseudo=false
MTIHIFIVSCMPVDKDLLIGITIASVMSNNRVVFLSDVSHEGEQGPFTEATNDSHTKNISLPTLALLPESMILVMEKEDADTCGLSLYSIMRAPPLPPELVSSLTEQVEKMVLLTENELAGADEANEMHQPLVALVRERERAGEVAEERTQLVGEAVEVMWVMLEELRVRGDVREVRWKMLWLLRVSFVIAVWLRAREPAVRKKRGVFIELEVVPVIMVALRLREGELSERWKRMGVMGFEELWEMARAETVREPCACAKRAEVADGSGEEDADENDENEENDDADCDDCECEFCGWGMPLEAMVVAVVPFPVIFVFGARNVRVFVGVKVETRREREASSSSVMRTRANSIVLHGLSCVIPQRSVFVPLFDTILKVVMRGSHPLKVSLSVCPLFHTLLAGVVEPHCWNGDWVMALPLKNTSFPLSFLAVLPSKKQNVMNFIPLIQE